MNSDELNQHMAETFAQALAIAEKKNNDYADFDDPFKNFRLAEAAGVTVEQGILVRMMDKMSRIGNGLSKELKVSDETISDTLSDLINYAAILKAYLDSKKGE